MQFKFLCHCGTKYAFEAEPVNGQMPWAVKCPRCGADATVYANQIIQQAASAPATSVTNPAAPPAPPVRPAVRVEAIQPAPPPPPAPAAAKVPPPAPVRVGSAAPAPAPPPPAPGTTPPDNASGPPRSSMTFSPVAVPSGAPKLRVGSTRYSEGFKEEEGSSTS